MSKKKNTKKKNHAPIKTREQLMAEKKSAEAATKKKTVIITSIVLAVIVGLIIMTVCLALSGRDPGLKVNGEAKDTVYVKMTVKDYGDIILKLDGKEAPITVKNFVTLVNQGFYNGLTFHRVMNDFMIQAGDPNADGSGGSANKITGEFEENGYHNCIAHGRGVISMARRSNDNNSASSQFFICNATNETVSHLDGSYAAFGYVISGMDVVDLITTKTAMLGDSNGVIGEKDKQAVISSMEVISAREAKKYS